MQGSYGKYTPIRKLGRGASGTVYLAEDSFTGTQVALKVLDLEVVTSARASKGRIKQLLNEASLVGKLSHPHIAAILDASVSEDSGYLAMEFVPGGDLSQFIPPGELLSVPQAIEMAF
jgi:serine/threonine protein kinase